jgi:hypothetical protein
MKKKYLYALIFTPLLLLADLNIEKVNDALSNIKSDKSLAYFSNNKTLLTKLKVSKTDSINKADVLLFPKKKNSKKIVIVDSYNKLKEDKNSIGAIYIKKGRTQIMFIAERLKKKGLKMTNSEYRISECHLNPICFLKLTQ